MVVVLKGHSPVSAVKHVLERLRCSLCGSVFKTNPENLNPDKKYDESVAVSIVIAKYFAGIPLYRLEDWQDMVGVPLKDATQWDLIEKLADRIYPIFTRLHYLSAQGELLYNDDTTVKILSLMKENKTFEKGERRGMFTTGVVSEWEGRRIVLYLSGRRHSGENMTQIMSMRSPYLPTVIRMADALSSNMSKEFVETLCKCLAHGRRKFVEIYDFFPESCHFVIDILAHVYHNDAITKERTMSNQERLAYHQEHSAPQMEKLKKWLDDQIGSKKVEPNSSLGKAIQYLLNHWEGLTQFLRVAGAPLDNNITERMLKVIIRIRKNSLFYKTEHGASIGGMFSSIIQTCRENGINPFDYLMRLQENRSALFKSPDDWLPWNYHQTLEKRGLKSHSPPDLLGGSLLAA